MFDPRDAFREVGTSNDIDVSIAVDIQRSVCKVFVVVGIGTARDFANFMLLPIRGSVPGVTTEDIEFAIVVKVRNADGLEG